MYVSTSGRGQRAAQNDRIHCPNEQVFPDIYYLLHGNCLSDLRIVSTNEVAMSVIIAGTRSRDGADGGRSLSRTDPQIIADAGY